MTVRYYSFSVFLMCLFLSIFIIFPVSGSDPTIVSMVYVGDKGDYSYLSKAFSGLEKARDGFNLTVREILWNSSAPEDPVIDRAGNRSSMVLVMGDIMNGYEQEISQINPDVPVVMIDGPEILDSSVKSISFSMYGASYLAGVLAANQTTTGNVGVIAGVNAPVIQSFTEGFQDGVRAEDPDVNVTISYIADDYSGFSMPEKAGEITREMYRNNTDVIYAVSGGSGLGIISTAQNLSGLFIIATDADQSGLASDTVIASAVKSLDTVVYNEIEECVSGKFSPGSEALSLVDEGTSLVPNIRFENVSSLIDVRINEAIEKEKIYSD
ncbi:BMP family ABC transporter substrate-binding protein [Methanospirillum stamsii]|uniref:ABC transporter substrate-binding protein PnrA-like domain-containing protein n=1 Tax=Methanospirillum stamsii TaxID=1277351 RepID=A0A2V2NIW9_9EURY|nr:BMP family ABC transporter substrate-binding protein [Methanospirillum stamsii]PWR76298.1 hypothetical protein DLD82_00365 [Methanospirillum stamsii]